MDESRPSRLTHKESYFVHNSLLCLVKALEKRYTTIDLRNETCVTGKIIEVDGYMNIILKDAALYDTDENYRYFSNLYIQARNIRNVHIPSDISIRKTIKNQVTQKPKTPTKKKTTFKQSRAQKQQKETLELVKKIKKEANISENKNN